MEGNENDGAINEGVEVVISTKDLNYELMLDAQLWSWFITTFHINGISSFLARFLYKYSKIEYSTFYEKLYVYIEEWDWWKKEKYEIRYYFDQWMRDGEIDHPRIEGVKILGWNLIYRSTANIMNENRYDYTWDMLAIFLKKFDIDSNISDELMEFQKNYFVKYEEINKFPKLMHSNYDFLGYLQSDQTLLNSVNYKFEFLEDVKMSRAIFINTYIFLEDEILEKQG